MCRDHHVAPGPGHNTVADPFVWGINYPWVNCNWDFGSRPFHLNNDAKWTVFEASLHELRSLGFDVIRFWILGDGLIFPWGGNDASHYASGIDAMGQLIPSAPIPAFDESVDGQFREDFVRLLRACGRTGMKLIPSLLSFGWFLPKADVAGHTGITQGGRARFVTTHRAEFVEVVLKTLLTWSLDFRDRIFAWEVMNEPDWVVQGPLLGTWRQRFTSHNQPVTAGEMWGFLEMCLQTITSPEFDFPATVGFVDADMPWLDGAGRSAAISFLRGLAARGRYVHQLHYYPPATHFNWPAVSPVRPCLMGEFSSGTPNFYPSTISDEVEAVFSPALPIPWPEPPHLQESEFHHYLHARMHAIEMACSGQTPTYAGALLWSANDDSRSCRSVWGDEQKTQVRSYLRPQTSSELPPWQTAPTVHRIR